ncbi:hypothetical protein ACGFX8_19545 [Streptomyces sp. NPDC048362]|uniref:hypothetical protein n=1 Tax=Streptomyces sp. NPDC048362 TaxID=3365539 RepID=UPI003720FB09
MDGMPGGEGAFVACSFRLAQALHGAGREAEARESFDRLVGLANDVGLPAEEHDPGRGRRLGGFPQVFGHIAPVTTALTLFGDDEAG